MMSRDFGCMTPLRELEINKRLNEYTHGAVRESLRHIVGVQFQKLCNNWRKYLGTVWILGCTDNVSGNGYMGGIV